MRSRGKVSPVNVPSIASAIKSSRRKKDGASVEEKVEGGRFLRQI